MDRKGNTTVGIIIALFVIFGIVYLLGKTIDITKENPNQTDAQIIGRTGAEATKESAGIISNFFCKLFDKCQPINNDNNPSTNNTMANQNATT